MNTGGERWATLRDREAMGEALQDDELHELLELERSDAVAAAYAGQLRELERHVRGHPTDSPSARDRALVDRALDAVQVTSQPLRTRTRDPDADLSSAIDPEGPRWIRSGSIGLSVLLALGAIVALVTYEPKSAPRAPLSTAAGAVLPAPTVEALTTAHTGKRGGRLRRGGQLLASDQPLGVGDELRAAEKPGCFVIEPSTTVCVAPLGAVRLGSLALKGSVVEVLEGRAIATHEGQRGSFELGAGDVRARALSGVFGLERSEDDRLVRLRVLDGQVSLRTPFGHQELGPSQLGIARNDARALTVEALPEGQKQREWELRSTALPASALSSRQPAASQAR